MTTQSFQGTAFRPNAKGFNLIIDQSLPQDTPNNSVFINRGLMNFAITNLIGRRAGDFSQIAFMAATQYGANVSYKAVKAGETWETNGNTGTYSKDALIATSVQLNLPVTEAMKLCMIAS